MPTPIIERARRYIAKMPPGIEGKDGSTATFNAACALVRGFALDQDTAFELLEEWSEAYCAPPWEEHELWHKLRDAMASPRPLGYLLENPPLDDPNASAAPMAPNWPTVDYPAISDLFTQPRTSQVFDLASLRAASPVETSPLTAQSVLRVLFPGNPLITAGNGTRGCKTTLLGNHLPKADTMQFIVPNAATKCEGLTQGDKPSQHCLSIVGPRQYLVLENDFKAGGECGLMLLRGWMEDLAPLDVNAFLIGHLKSIVPTLAMVVFSGSKSLHAWFNVSALADDVPTLKGFMRVAVKLGFDRAGWTKSQLCRMPGGTRKGKGSQAPCRQSIYYFDPAHCLLP